MTKGKIDKTVLEVKQLKQYFPLKKEKLRQEKQFVHAVDDISFTVDKGTTLSVVGESGCGKSTLGRSILRLENPTEGQIIFEGQDITELNKRQLKDIRGQIQVIFQDPFASLNPRRTIRQVLEEALDIQNVLPKEAREARMIELITLVGLPVEALERLPHEFSGGQRQRIGIARALSVNPELIVCDEAVSALDVSIQAQILNLLKKLQNEIGLTYLFISHDLSVVRHISDRVMVMYLGKIMEIGHKDDLFNNPLHPYTKALLSAIPTTDLHIEREQIEISGDVPSPINPPTGCRFHTRCPFAQAICKTQEPVLEKKINSKENHQIACHFAESLSSNA